MAVEQTLESRFWREIVCIVFNKPQRGEYWPNSRRPLRITDLIWVQQIREFLRFGISLCISKKWPGFDENDLAVASDSRCVQLIELFDLFGRSLFHFGTGKYLAQYYGDRGSKLF